MGNPQSILDRLNRHSARHGKCLLWTGHVMKNGYGAIMIEKRKTLVHRALWEATHGPIPSGLTIDHLCHEIGQCQGGPACLHRRCIEPAHLQAVTIRENLMRSNTAARRESMKTECIAGHAFTPINTYVNHKGHRYCRACMALRQKAMPGWVRKAITEGRVAELNS